MLIILVSRCAHSDTTAFAVKHIEAHRTLTILDLGVDRILLLLDLFNGYINVISFYLCNAKAQLSP